jgi:uncharacterized membrane protein
MYERLKFFINRIRERLWVKPLLMCVVAIAIAFISKSTDYTGLGEYVPEISTALIKTLLTIISTSMLGIATFSVASMVSAYASASSTATPRTFSLVIADDVSQNALSAFIGAFIFSIISLIALGNSYYDKAGRFTLFTATLLVFAIVIITFVRWVDSIARLGRLGTIIDKAETATAKALKRRRSAPTLGGVPIKSHRYIKQSVCGELVGYVQRVDIAALQAAAEDSQIYIEVAVLPGMFVAPGRVLAYLTTDSDSFTNIDTSLIIQAFVIAGERIFDEDPRFGLTVLSEIASRALSPAINDPGTAIDVIGTLVRLFVIWGEPIDEDEKRAVKFDRVAVPEISLQDMFDDAFSAIARDGAGKVEVVVWLQRAFESLALLEDDSMREAAKKFAGMALARAENTLQFPQDLATVRKAAQFIDTI